MGNLKGFSAILIAVAANALSLAPSLAAPFELISFNTSDGERIDGDLYSSSQNRNSIAIVAPGFAQHRQTKVMKQLCEDISKTMDSFCLDFRGTGTSTGFYTFGEKEPLDLEPVLEWAAAHYQTVNLIGLSLGAYAAGRAAYQWPKNVSKLLLISCPTSVEDIVTSGGIFDSIFASVVDPGAPELRTGADWFFRWGFVFGEKPDLSELGAQVSTSASFLIGEEDHLVFESLSRKVYDSFAGEKSWDVFPHGGHAESMLIQNAPAFEQWLVSHLQTHPAE